MAMYVDDPAKKEFLKKVFKEVSEKQDSTDLLSDISIEELQKLGLKVKPLKDPEKV
jgi:hypothetical protein